MRLVLQPIKLDDRFFPDISFMLPALPEVFRFDDNFAINKPISKLPLQLFELLPTSTIRIVNMDRTFLSLMALRARVNISRMFTLLIYLPFSYQR
jgi:hypothetical protein